MQLLWVEHVFVLVCTKLVSVICVCSLSHTAVLPECFGHGATRQAVCTRCNDGLVELHHRMLDQLQGLAGQSVFEQNDEDMVLISTVAPPEAPEHSDGLGTATRNFAEACLANEVCVADSSPSSLTSSLTLSPRSELPLGFARPDLVERSGVPLPAFRVASPPLDPSDSGVISRTSSILSEDELPLGFSRPDLNDRRHEMKGVPLPEFRTSAPISPAQRIKQSRQKDALPLGFLRHDLVHRPEVDLPDFHREEDEDVNHSRVPLEDGVPFNVWRG